MISSLRSKLEDRRALADELRNLTHLFIADRVRNEGFTRGGGGAPRVRPVEYRAHGAAMKSQLQEALYEVEDERRESRISETELKALGSVITLEGESSAFPLKIESLERFSGHTKTPKLPKWLLLSVQPGDETVPERAIVWVADSYRADFIKIFEDYLEKKSKKAASENWETADGNPANRALVANIARIRRTVLEDLWQSDGEPPRGKVHWWELWVDTAQGDTATLRKFADAYNLKVLEHSLVLHDRAIFWVQATWAQLEVLPFTSVPIAEVRRPEFIDTVEDLLPHEQNEYVEDLAQRVVAAPEGSPAVCHLDTGVARTHRLLSDSLAPSDLHTVIGTSGFDTQGHGTAMAGLALYGPLDDLLSGSGAVRLRHRLESVRILPDDHEPDTDPLDYGTVTIEAVALTEIAARRPRVFCMPVSTDADRPGVPTLWSATVDALATGTDIIRDGAQLTLLGTPDVEASRLIVIAAGNVETYQSDHRLESDTSGVDDPAQSWNALTVGAYTNLVEVPTDPDYLGWSAMAAEGELSPHSRTSLPFGKRAWPIKPDVCFEGGNV